MNCDQFQEQANLFIDGELGPDAEAELLKHLSQCEDCGSFVDLMSKVNRVRDAERIEFPSSLDQRLFGRLAIDRAAKLKSRHLRSGYLNYFKKEIVLPLPFAAALVIILLFGGMLFGLLMKTGSEDHAMMSVRQVSGGQPSAVILFYEHPTIDVVGKPVLKEARYDKNNNP